MLSFHRGAQNRSLAQQWLDRLNEQWELQSFLQDCHEVGASELHLIHSSELPCSRPFCVPAFPGGSIDILRDCHKILNGEFFGDFFGECIHSAGLEDAKRVYRDLSCDISR